MLERGPSSSGSTAESRSDRLESWKDIAVYLRRDVSTVQRWEKREGMPVHRHLHDRLGSVYAFRSELDTWCRSRRARVGARHVAARRWLTVGGVAALTVVVVLGLLVPVFRIAPVTSSDPVAHQEYLVGRYYLWRYDEEHLQRAIEHFERATLIDPTFAAAFAALSNAWWARGMFGPAGMAAVESSARTAAHRAWSVDDDLAVAWVAQADLKRIFDRDPVGAEAMFRRALTLDPDSVEGHHSYALLLMGRGRFPEALAHIERANALEPLAPAIESNFGRILYRAGRFEEALPHFQRALELEPEMRSHYGRLGDVYEQLGQYDRALEAYDRSGMRGPSHQARVARIFARVGKRREATQLLESLDSGPGSASLFHAAAAYAALGDTNRASSLLFTMIDRDDPALNYFAVDPRFASLHAVPQWPELLRRVGVSAERRQ